LGPVKTCQGTDVLLGIYTIPAGAHNTDEQGRVGAEKQYMY